MSDQDQAAIEEFDAPLELLIKCRECLEVKGSEHFHRHPNGRNGFGKLCKVCRKSYRHKLDLQSLYGVSANGYESMLYLQRGRCAICGTDKPDRGKRSNFCVDHDHVTGVVRGLLCNSCNRAIGQFRDNPEIMKRAIEYLTSRGAP